MALRLADGTRLDLGPEDVDLSQETEAGWGVAAEGGLTVALDLEITPHLRDEGLARDLLRLVQDARKAAGLAVTDRIELAVKTEEDLGRVLERHGPWIAREALAVSVVQGDPVWEPAHRERADLDGRPVEIALRPVAA